MPKNKKPDIGHNSGGTSGKRLSDFLERIERLEEEKRVLSEDVKFVKSEAKGVGFCVKTINKILKERRMTKEQIEEEQALLDIYRAALGMLGDTPLGNAAIRRLSPQGRPSAPEQPKPMEISAGDIDRAREEGSKAAADGKPVTDNPYPARDPRRAAWDEAWCAAMGSDGMEIPAAFQRKKPEDKDHKKPTENEPSDDEDDGEDD